MFNKPVKDFILSLIECNTDVYGLYCFWFKKTYKIDADIEYNTFYKRLKNIEEKIVFLMNELAKPKT